MAHGSMDDSEPALSLRATPAWVTKSGNLQSNTICMTSRQLDREQNASYISGLPETPYFCQWTPFRSSLCPKELPSTTDCFYMHNSCLYLPGCTALFLPLRLLISNRLGSYEHGVVLVFSLYHLEVLHTSWNATY